MTLIAQCKPTEMYRFFPFKSIGVSSTVFLVETAAVSMPEREICKRARVIRKTHCAIPPPRLRGITPIMRQEFQFAQGEIREMEIGRTWVRFAGREVLTLVLFNEDGSPPLLGALALEEAFLGVDPVGRRLIPVRGLLMRAQDA